MVCRRRWQLALGLMMGALAPAMALAAAPAPAASAAAMVNATDTTAKAKIAQDILDAAKTQPSTKERDDYAQEVVRAFEPLLDAKDPKHDDSTRLNAARAIAGIDTISTGDALRRMLNNPDDTVRYFGARGLELTAHWQLMIGAKPVLGDLVKVAGKEKSSVVAAAILDALVEYHDLQALLEALKNTSALVQADVPDPELLDAAARAFGEVNKLLASTPANAAQKEQAADDAARWASFSAQQYAAADKGGTEKGVTQQYITATGGVLEATTQVIKAVTGNSSISTPGGSTSAEVLLNTGSLVGTPGGSPGILQKAMSKVAVPPQIKAP